MTKKGIATVTTRNAMGVTLPVDWQQLAGEQGTAHACTFAVSRACRPPFAWSILAHAFLTFLPT